MMEQSDNESMSEGDSKDIDDKSDTESETSKESDDIKNESNHSRQDTGQKNDESNNSVPETTEPNEEPQPDLKKDSDPQEQASMNNTFASVWVKVEMKDEDDESEPEDDATDIISDSEDDAEWTAARRRVVDETSPVNYEPSTEKKKKQKRERHNVEKPEMDAKKPRKCPTKVLKCQVCDYTTVYKTGLIMHMIGHTTEKKYACPECNYKSKYRNALTRHIRIEHQNMEEPSKDPPKIYKCDECDYTANFKWNLKAHKRKHNVEKQFKCEHCEFATAYRHNFLKHSRTHVSKDKPFTFYKCDKCPFVTKYEGHITRHLAKIHNEVTDTAYKCDFCDFSTRVKWRLNIHKARSKQESVMVCPYCNFQTFYMCESKKHKVVHYDVMYVQKSKENYSVNTHNSQIDATTGLFSDTHEMDSYIDEQSGSSQKEYTTDPNCIDWKNIKVLESDDKERPFRCLMCSYTSRYKAAVKRHYQRHHTGTQNRPYECVHCGFSTKTKDKIALHNRRSKSDVTLSCNICHYTTIYKCQFVIHQKQHYDNKCSECDYSCKRKYELQKHYMITHMGNGLKCQYCDYKATRKESLLCHETIHTGAKPYKCNYCDYTGVRSYLLNKHMKRYHSNFVTDMVVVSESKIESLKHETTLHTVARASIDFAL